jgi:hypothetical protein
LKLNQNLSGNPWRQAADNIPSGRGVYIDPRNDQHVIGSADAPYAIARSPAFADRLRHFYMVPCSEADQRLALPILRYSNISVKLPKF